MLNDKELKNYLIIDNEKKYNEINKKIMQVTKTYFKTIKNHSFEITQIENKLNEYNLKSSIKIKQLLQNQQILIKELISFINKIITHKTSPEINLLEIVDKKDICSINEDNKKFQTKSIKNLKNLFPRNITSNSHDITSKTQKINIKKYFKSTDKNCQIKNIYTNNRWKNKNKISNKNQMIALLNNISLKSIKDLKNNSDFIKHPNKSEKKLLNKQQIKKEIELSNKKLFKSKSELEIPNNARIMNHSYKIKTKSLSNINPCYSNGNYTIDEEKNNNYLNYDYERQSSGYNRTYNDGSLPNLLSMPKKQKKIKYRPSKSIPRMEDFYLINNYTFTNFNFTNNSSHKSIDNIYNRNEHPLIFLNTNITNIHNINNLIKGNNSSKKFWKQIFPIPFINNGIQIIPTRYTKEVLNSSYKILNKYRGNKFKKSNYY